MQELAEELLKDIATMYDMPPPPVIPNTSNPTQSDQEYGALQQSMCEDCVQYILRVQLAHKKSEGITEETIRESLGTQPCLKRVHALIMVVMQLRDAGVDLTEIPDDPELMQMWLTFHINNGLNPVVVYKIQEAINKKYPECKLKVANLISRWLSADLEDTLTLKMRSPANYKDIFEELDHDE